MYRNGRDKLKKLCFFNAVITFFVVVEIFLWDGSHFPTFSINEFYFYSASPAEDVAQRCSVPELKLWDPSIDSYVNEDPPNSQCNFDYPLVRMEWTPGNSSILKLTDRGKRKIDKIQCSYQIITRNFSDKQFMMSKPKIANFPIMMPAEFVKIACKENGSVVYNDVFATIIPKKENTTTMKPNKEMFNIVIIGIDSVSKNTFMRFLPKSFDYLTSVPDTFVFERYNKIGENTYPNIVPLLTGGKVYMNYPREKSRLLKRVTSMNEHPLIWKDFESAGYSTCYAEDLVKIETFNYHSKGFTEQPTTHHARPFFMALEGCCNAQQNPGLFENEKEKLKESLAYCTVGRKLYEVLWDYSLRQFVSKYAAVKRPFFVHSWENTLAHDTYTYLKTADDSMHEMLKYLLANSTWKDNTFFIVLSDHGQRITGIRSSFIGMLESKLPFLSITIPPAFKKKYPLLSSNLAENSKNLITPIDIYSTMKQILHLSTAENIEESLAPFNDSGISGYGISLFNYINPLRNCEDVGIPALYCACRQEGFNFQTADVDSFEAKAAADSVVDAIMESLEKGVEEGYCVRLSLNNITSFRKLATNAHQSNNTVGEYYIRVKLSPSGGEFDAIVRHVTNGLNATSSFRVTGIDRTNLYGSQPNCLPNELSHLDTKCMCPEHFRRGKD